jgi:CelD/BcsL family acetyltransferase involved in cellulose biosynthesis
VEVSILTARALTPHHLAAWAEVVRSTPSLASPYFTPEFTLAVAAVRADVEVAVLSEQGVPAGFFPFQRGPDGVGRPVAGRLSDFHGVVARPGADWDGLALVRACGLRAWRFDHLLAEQTPLQPFHWATAPSPYVDLAGGFEAWRQRHRTRGSREVENLLYKARKAVRLAGPIRFELRSADDRAFEALLRWKGRQYRETGAPDLTAIPWVTGLLDHLRRQRTAGFEGVLSSLHLGDRLAAVHLGLRTPGVWHYWIPAYDPELAIASPGRICLLELLRAAAEAGAGRFDLGRGSEPYKYHLASGATPVAQGAVDLRPGASALGRGWFFARRWLSRSPLRGPLLGPARWIQRAQAARHPD